MTDTQIIGFCCSLVGAFLSIYVLTRSRILYFIKRREFVKISYDGSFVIVMPGEESAFIDEEDDPSEYKIETVRMTMRDFEALPDFNGF